MKQSRLPLVLGIGAGILGMALAFAAGTTAEEQWQLAARWTARLGFPLLIITYSASSLLRLWPNDTTKALVLDRRWWGLGFAACHTIHLFALTTYLRTFGDPPEMATLAFGGLAYVLMFAMVLTSNRAAMKALGPWWKRLHTAGIHWLWFLFAFSYFGQVMTGKEMPYAGVALGVALLALALRIAAWAKAWRRRRATEAEV